MDLILFANLIYARPRSQTHEDLHTAVMRYRFASFIRDGARVPFMYHRFMEVSLMKGHGSDITSGDLWALDPEVLKDCSFKVCGRTYRESRAWPMATILWVASTELLHNSEKSRRKASIWIQLLRLASIVSRNKNNTLKLTFLYDLIDESADQDVFWAELVTYRQNTIVVPHRTSLNLATFSFADFYQHRGYEGGDENVNEEGIFVLLDSPTAEYLPVRECDICMEGLFMHRFPQSRIALTCTHDSRICLDCLKDGLESQILEAQMHDALVCPTCKAPMTFEEVRTWSNIETFQR